MERLSKTFAELSNSWHRFWFSPLDPTTLCIMRILVGAMCTYTVFVWGLQFETLLGDNGWNSPSLLSEIQADGFAPSFWWYVPESARMPVHFGCLVVLLCFTVGFFTRVSSVLSMAILISYSYRAHLANYGLDQINAILTFYLCIAPSGAKFSIDAFLRNRRASKPIEPTASANLATRLIQIHFCVIYSFAGLAKLQGEGWWNGEAIWMAVANREYQTLDMTWIAWFPWISDVVTHTTILFELSFWVLIWGRFRPLMLAIGAALHVGIGAMMGMWTFAFIMIFGHLSFWSPALVNRILNRLSGKQSPHDTPVDDEKTNRNPTEPDFRSKPRRIVCFDTSQTGRVRYTHYFNSRNYECYTTGSLEEAIELTTALKPLAVIVVGSTLSPEAVLRFNTATAGASQRFYILDADRTFDIAHVADSCCHVLSTTHNLGDIRRAIEQRDAAASCLSTAVFPIAESATDASNHEDEEQGSCDQIPNKPR